VDQELFNRTYLEGEREIARRVLDVIVTPANALNMIDAARVSGVGVGVARLVIRRGVEAGLVHFNGPPTRYFLP